MTASTFQEDTVAKVLVYPFEIYDIRNDAFQRSRRWGTHEGIKGVRGRTVQGRPGVEVDESALEVDGLTKIDFTAEPPRSGFQSQVNLNQRS